MDYRAVLTRRLVVPAGGPLCAETDLAHFALITYAAPAERLARVIPQARFSVPEFDVQGVRLAFFSAVMFLDVDFRFPRLWPWARFSFAQTNYRAYVIDRKTGEHVVWFFGTTLGSRWVHVPRVAWRLPWHPAQYALDCVYSAAERRYTRYAFTANSTWGPARARLQDSGVPVENVPGFAELGADAFKLILTHPIEGYFHRLDGRVGSYSIWHPEMALTQGSAEDAYFGVFERLGLLTAEAMRTPHSVLLMPHVPFKIWLPPHLVPLN